MKRNRMDDGALEAIVNNEIEWRKMLWKKVEEVEQEQDKIMSQISKINQDITGMKVKVGFFGATFGFVAGLIVKFIELHK